MKDTASRTRAARFSSICLPAADGLISGLMCLLMLSWLPQPGFPLTAVSESTVHGSQVSGAPYLWVGDRKMSYDEVERLLRYGPGRIVAIRHNPKSRTASSLYLAMEGPWEAKFRVVADPAATRRNEDVKREVACYVVSRFLFPDGGIVKPCVFRSFRVEELMPLLDGDTVARLRSWAVEGKVWGALSLVGGRTVRAEDSVYFGSHSRPRPEVAPDRFPPEYLRQLGDMNVLTILTHNGDLHGENWEIREEDGACYVVDNGLTFTFDGRILTHRRWRMPCKPVAAAVGSATIGRVRHILTERHALDQALKHLQETPWGLSQEERDVIFRQAEKFLDCWEDRPRIDLSRAEFLRRVNDGTLSPFNSLSGNNQPMVQVTDW